MYVIFKWIDLKSLTFTAVLLYSYQFELEILFGLSQLNHL